jgi:DNA processing protein
MLTLTENSIPEVLRMIPTPPKILYALGDNLENILSRPRVAIVGSRKVTPYGKNVTQQLAGDLAARGVVVVSGLAFGVDAVAHQAALDAGGITMAILPSGVNRVYPSAHQQLADRIVKQGGVLLSEYPDGSIGYKTKFVARNRLVSGISDALLVTEAMSKSGTMHTAAFAHKQGRPVFAVPGNITSPLSAGTNHLIKHGAQLVTEASDILRALGIHHEVASAQIHSNDPREQSIIELLQSGTTDGGDLFAQCNLSVAEFSQVITMLEIKDIVKPLGNNQWALL